MPILTIPKGVAGLVYLTTLATQTVPAGNNYVEGCWHLFPQADTAWPGVVLGKGIPAITAVVIPAHDSSLRG